MSNSNARQVLSYRSIALRRLLSETIIVTLLQLIGFTTSTFIPVPTPIWLGTGTACAFIFLRGYHVIIGIILGTFLACTLQRISLPSSILFTSLVILQTLSIFYICQFLTPTPVFYKRFTFLVFCLINIFNALVFSYLLTLCVPLNGYLLNYTANLNGILIVPLFFAAIDANFPEWQNSTPMNRLLKFNYLNNIIFLFLLCFLINLLLYIGLPGLNPTFTNISLSCMTIIMIFLSIKQ